MQANGAQQSQLNKKTKQINKRTEKKNENKKKDYTERKVFDGLL